MKDYQRIKKLALVLLASVLLVLPILTSVESLADTLEEEISLTNEDTLRQLEMVIDEEAVEENNKEFIEEVIVEPEALAPIAISANSARVLANLTIVIDPGHGGRDPGATVMHNGTQIRESDLVLDVSLRVRDLLNQAGINVSLTRERDVYVSLADRARHANQLEADLFVSVHANAFSNTTVNGIETFFFGTAAGRSAQEHHGIDAALITGFSSSNRIQDSRLLAEKIQARLLERLRLNDRGVRQGNFHVIRETNMAAVLTEIGFLTSSVDRPIIISEDGRNQAAAGIYLGILDYLAAQGYEIPNRLYELTGGWVQRNGDWFFYRVGGRRHTGWLSDRGSWYFFNTNGVMQTGWITHGGNQYFLNPAVGRSGHTSSLPYGAMRTGWVTQGGNQYFLNPRSGQGGHTSSLPHGAMRTGWLSQGGNWYFLNPRSGRSGHTSGLPQGAMRTGWVRTGGNWYFLNPRSGRSGHTSGLPQGAMRTGWVRTGGNWYFLNPRSGRSGHTSRLPHGAMRTGWAQVGNHWFFMNGSGRMQTGWLRRGNHWYFLDNSGRMRTGWVQINGTWRHFSANGRWQR